MTVTRKMWRLGVRRSRDGRSACDQHVMISSHLIVHIFVVEFPNHSWLNSTGVTRQYSPDYTLKIAHGLLNAC